MYVRRVLKMSVFAAIMMLCVAFTFSHSVSASAAVKVKISNGVCTVSGKGKMTKKQIPTARQKKTIKKVVIKKGVTAIPKRAFMNCSKLKSVSFPDTVKTIPQTAFYECKKLTKETLPGKLTTIEDLAFFRCESLSSIKLPESLKRIESGAFMSTNIKNLVIPDNCKELGTGITGELRTLTLPGDFKIMWIGDSCEDYPSIIWSDEINFSTDLDISNVNYLRSGFLNVSSSDANYTSVDGVIYSKDKKTLVRVPSGKHVYRKELNISEGCEVVPLSAFLYPGLGYEDGVDFICKRLCKITFPSTVKKIDKKLYPQYHNVAWYDSNGYTDQPRGMVEFDIKTTQLSEDDIKALNNAFDPKSDSVSVTSDDVIINGVSVDINNW